MMYLNKRVFILIYLSFVAMYPMKLHSQPCDTCAGHVNLIQLQNGLEFIEYVSPIATFWGDSKVQILRIDPKYFDFELYNSTAMDHVNRMAREWADTFCLQAVINAGMYNLKDFKTNRGFMKNFRHYNNPKRDKNWGAMLGFNAKDSAQPTIEIYDVTCSTWEDVEPRYNTVIQSMRIFNCDGVGQPWSKRASLKSSICVLALDSKYRVMFIFTRSLYSMNQFIEIMKLMPFDIQKAVYMEGGPEASMYICSGEFERDLFGNYVTYGYQMKNNEEIWKLPNVIGIRAKKH
ncbi:MAG: phosphodiester glycosidase family protein [Bacteroidota bacterium]